MQIAPLLFWSITVASIGWCGTALINGLVSEHYHPMAVLGDRFSELRTYAVAVPILAALTLITIWFWRRPLASAFYWVGLVPAVVAALLPLLPRVDSGYEQIYWIGDQAHSVPWAFGPYNGDPQRGGDFFLIRVWGEDLRPYYAPHVGRPDAHFILGKSNGFDFGAAEQRPDKDCLTDGNNLKCEWQAADYIYVMSIKASSAPADPQALFKSVEELLDSFEIHEDG